MGAEIDEPRAIDWGTAAVADGRLSVALTGEPSKVWGEHMEGVIRRLDARRADRIEVNKDRIQVSGVDAESAEELRHLLESAAAQTNADLVAPPAEKAEKDDAGADDGLSEVFRSFAEPGDAR